MAIQLNGKPLVVESQRYDPQVISYLERLKFLGRITAQDVEYTTLDRVLKLREETQRSQNQEKSSEARGLAQKMFADAVQKRASDIHIRVHSQHADVLMRVHGALTKITQWPAEQAQRICAAIYGTMCDVANNTYVPTMYQDARIGKREHLPNGVHGIRVASGPTVTGTNMVLRLLYEDVGNVGKSIGDRLMGLGYHPEHIKAIEVMQEKPTGITIISGPTGSGKSTTLKHVLEAISLSNPDLNTLTVEDPPEYPIADVVQMPVTNADTDDARRAAFGSAIRAALRMDPDIIMIGEIRDGESARLALRAAMTGHQVWTTLHANDPFNVLLRMEDVLSSSKQGDPKTILGDSSVITGLIAQRLIRTLCKHCKKPLIGNESEISQSLHEKLSKAIVDMTGVSVRGPGCTHCQTEGTNRGISGRTVVAEVVLTDEEIMHEYRINGIYAANELWQKRGGMTMQQHVMEKIQAGEIDPVWAIAMTGTRS